MSIEHTHRRRMIEEHEHARRVLAQRGELEDALARLDASMHAREQHEISLRLSAPKRARAGAIITAPHDAAHLPLFTAANEPRLL